MSERNANRPGYKQTSVGWIPVTWKVFPFKKIAERRGERFDPKNNISLKCIELEHIERGTGVLSGFVESNKQASNKNRFYKNDVLFGKLRPYLRKYTHSDFEGVCSSEIWVFKNREICISKFLFFIIQTDKFISNSNKTSGTKMPRAEWSLVSEINFPIPPLSEQRKIAEILSTWDAAIQLVEQQIKAKQRLKKALMQQLLTGKLRYIEDDMEYKTNHPSRTWEVHKFCNVFKRISRPVPENIKNILSITARAGFVTQQEKFSKIIAGKTLSKYIFLYKGEFAYNKGNSKPYPQGCIYKLEEFENGAVPNVYFCFRPNKKDINSLFYKYFFENGMLNSQLRKIINSGVRNDGLLNINPDDFFNMNIFVPPIKEQNKIAQFINSITTEIDLLFEKLIRLKIQKHGLMQKLLTGEVRMNKKGEEK